VPANNSFDYAVLRVVPSAERGEFMNVGVVMHCPALTFLGCRVYLDDERFVALWPDHDLSVIRQHVEAFARICVAEPKAGPIAQLSRRERFHWMVSPRSTVIQVSPVHTGLCEDPEATIEELFRRLVLR
jgi:Protein of unknown function (DUF3037)